MNSGYCIDFYLPMNRLSLLGTLDAPKYGNFLRDNVNFFTPSVISTDLDDSSYPMGSLGASETQKTQALSAMRLLLARLDTISLLREEL